MNWLKPDRDSRAEWRKFIAAIVVQCALGAALLLYAYFGP